MGHWFWWLLIVTIIFSNVVKVSKVGQPREPIGAGEAAANVFECALWVWGIAYYGLR